MYIHNINANQHATLLPIPTAIYWRITHSLNPTTIVMKKKATIVLAGNGHPYPNTLLQLIRTRSIRTVGEESIRTSLTFAIR